MKQDSMLKSNSPIKRDDFFNSLETYCKLSKSSKKPMALILIDIENFSQINLQFGYSIGETLIYNLLIKTESLAKFANCTFRISDSILALILPVLENENLLALAASKILNELKAESKCKQYLINPAPRIGMAAQNPELINSETLFKEAQEYLAAAKISGQEFILHLEKEELDSIENFSEKFYTALTSNEFELYYQAKQNFSTGKTEHVEALLRWRIEENQFVSPERIIKEAEKSVENNFNLTKWVINRALRQLKEWKEVGVDIAVSVNVSASLIHRADFTTLVQDALSIWGIKPEFLMIEITETAFMAKKDLCHKNLNALRNMGVKLSIDDFGTGYSSLSYFKEIPANELKIDKAFVLNLMDSREDQILVNLMIEIAHSFNLSVVAEGIESIEAYNYLKHAGCDIAQGFYVSRPIEPGAFKDWLTKQNNA